MNNTLSEVDLHKISQLAYLDIVGVNSKGVETELTDLYLKDKIVSLEEVSNYYLQTAEGQEKLKERFSNMNDKGEEVGDLPNYIALLNEFNQPKYKDWTISDVVSNNKQEQSGFVALTVNAGDVSVVAFRGSEPIEDRLYLNDWYSDFVTAFMKESFQQAEARVYMENMIAKGKYPSYLTGHSLGGNLALYSSFILPPEYREKLITTTTFGAPGFNLDVLNTHQDAISELIASDKIIEIRNVGDIVPAILKNPTEGVYVDSTWPGPGLENHSLSTLELNKSGDSFKRSEQQHANTLPNVIKGVTLLLEKYPDASLEKMINNVFSIWRGDDPLYVSVFQGIQILSEYITGSLTRLFQGGLDMDRFLISVKLTIEINLLCIEAMWALFKQVVPQVVGAMIEGLVNNLGLPKEVATVLNYAVMKFIEGAKQMIERAYEEAVELLRSIADFIVNVVHKVSQKLDDIVGDVKGKVRERKTRFIEKVRSIRVDEYIHKVKSKAVWKVMNNWLVSMGGVKGRQIKADLDRLSDLQKVLIKKEERVRGLVNRILSQATGVISEVDRNYHEQYVQTQIRNLHNVCEAIRGDHQHLSEALNHKTTSLRSSIIQYKDMETRISRAART